MAEELDVGASGRRPLRVARLVNRLPPARGGKEIHVAELCRSLADLGVHQHLFARRGDSVDPRVPLSRLGDRFAADLRRTLVAYGAWSVAAFVRAHRRERFDLIHVHGDFVEAGAGAAAARLCGVPAVLTVHGGFGSSARHAALRRMTFSGMRHIWAVSHDLAESIARTPVNVPVVVRPSGVREEFFSMPREEGPGGIVAIGRLSPVKGLETLIEAHDFVADRLSLPWTVFAGGSGPYADRIREEIGSRPTMRCREEPNPSVLARALARASVFVLPSVGKAKLNEGVPTALLEAIAAGTPVVAADTGGVGRMLDDGRGGTLVPPGDSTALAAAIASAVENPADARERAHHASSLGWAVPWQTVAQEVLDGYAAVLEGQRA